MVPLQIRSQALRRMSPSPIANPMPGFGPLPSTTAPDACAGRTDRTGWRQADVARAIKAAEKADLRAYRIEIAPDGTISIVVGAAGEIETALPCEVFAAR